MKGEDVCRLDQFVNEFNGLSCDVTVVLDDHLELTTTDATFIFVDPIPVVLPTHGNVSVGGKVARLDCCLTHTKFIVKEASSVRPVSWTVI